MGVGRGWMAGGLRSQKRRRPVEIVGREQGEKGGDD